MRLRFVVPAAFAAAVLTAPASAAAQPACVAGTLESYLGLGASGCVVGGVGTAPALLFTGFGFGTGTGAPRPGFEAVTLTPFSESLGADRALVGFAIAFNGYMAFPPIPANLGTRFDSRAFRLDGTATALAGGVVDGRVLDLTLTTTPAGLLTGGAGTEAILEAPEARVFAIANCYRNAAPPPAPPVCSPRALPGSPFGFPGPLSYRLNATSAGYTQPGDPAIGVDLPSVRYGFVVDATATLVPEPSTFALGAVGGLALGATALLRRRPTAG